MHFDNSRSVLSLQNLFKFIMRVLRYHIPRTSFRVDIGNRQMSRDVLSANENYENHCVT